MKKIIIISIGIICLAIGSYLMWQSGKPDPGEIYTTAQFETQGLVSLDDFVKHKKAEELKLSKKDLEIKVSFLPDLSLNKEQLSTTLSSVIKEKIENSDLVFANLNNPIDDSFILSDAGFDVLNLGNDTIVKDGGDDLIATINALQNSEIDICGATVGGESRLKIVNSDGIKFGFLCYSYGPLEQRADENSAGIFIMDLKTLKEDITAYRREVNFLIVSMHSGTQNDHKVSKSQTDFAHSAIDLGADFVIGSGSNSVAKAEVYKNRYILYGLGNFIYNENWPESALEGVIAEVVFNLEGVKKIDFYPVKIVDNKPQFVSEENKMDILNYLELDFEE
jgi:poly-gamma-glutamate capsule biosynthesis protein CapA/YwtB (metallophosphatase superfamily)